MTDSERIGAGVGVVSAAEVQFARGKKLFRDGHPMSPRPADDDDLSPAAQVWFGWMVARASAWMKRREAMRKLGVRE